MRIHNSQRKVKDMQWSRNQINKEFKRKENTLFKAIDYVDLRLTKKCWKNLRPAKRKDPKSKKIKRFTIKIITLRNRNHFFFGWKRGKTQQNFNAHYVFNWNVPLIILLYYIFDYLDFFCLFHILNISLCDLSTFATCISFLFNRKYNVKPSNSQICSNFTARDPTIKTNFVYASWVLNWNHFFLFRCSHWQLKNSRLNLM